MTICKDYINLNFEWVENQQREFTFAIPDNAYSSLQFGSTIRLKLIQCSITYIDFKNAISIYIGGVSTTNFWSSNLKRPANYILLSHLDNHSVNNQLYFSTQTSNTPDYTIHDTPKIITILFKEDVGIPFQTQPFNKYKDGNLLLEFSYEEGIIDYQLAFNKRLNKL
jgi:hypothetical protein